LAELRAISDPALTVLDLQTNYGQSLALAAGIDAARGQYIVTLDGDQQNDPVDIPRLLTYCDVNDMDIVAGWRANRKDGFLLRKLPSRLANGLIRWATGVPFRDLGCGLKVFRADVAKNLKLYGELHRFILVLAQLEGARMAQLPVSHRSRHIGRSKYGLGRTLRVVSDLFLLLFLKKYLRKPMHLFGTMGVLLLGTGLTVLCASLIAKLMTPGEPIGPALTAGLILTVGGLQFVAFGVIAEIQVRTYFESQGKKPYRVRRVYSPGVLVS
jgi:glycosyltransferase involved in cell wall biosynthesis